MAQKLGRYEILGVLGKGGMGIVCKARDPVIDRIVALKVLRKRDEMDGKLFEQFRLRFLQEARAAGQLNHPNIIAVYDAGTDPKTGLSYMAMEYVRGKNIEQYLAQSQVFPPEQVVRIGSAVADGLHYAHEKGIVHRDIKAANIILSQEGRPKIADFGIAKMPDSHLTQDGQFLGSPAFVAPEQIRGGTVDARSDIFSLGIVMYQMLTGEKPFTGEKFPTIVYQIMNANPTHPNELNPALPRALCDVIMKALEKLPANRYQTARELIEALRSSMTTEKPVQSAIPAELAQVGTASEDKEAPEEKTVLAANVDEDTGVTRAVSSAIGAPAGAPAREEKKRSIWDEHKAVLAALGIVAVLLGAFFLFKAREKQGDKPPEQVAEEPPAEMEQQTPERALTPISAPALIETPAPTPNPARTRKPARASRPTATPTPAPVLVVRTPTPVRAKTSFLYVKFSHGIASGNLVVSVDGVAELKAPLRAKKGIPIPGIGFGRKEVAEIVKLPPGEHSVKVSVFNDEDKTSVTSSITGTFKEKVTKRLKIELSKGSSQLNLSWED
jgi:tRNA A-37 threonylcarbamoyl transferase component Bud32